MRRTALCFLAAALLSWGMPATAQQRPEASQDRRTNAVLVRLGRLLPTTPGFVSLGLSVEYQRSVSPNLLLSVVSGAAYERLGRSSYFGVRALSRPFGGRMNGFYVGGCPTLPHFGARTGPIATAMEAGHRWILRNGFTLTVGAAYEYSFYSCRLTMAPSAALGYAF